MEFEVDAQPNSSSVCGFPLVTPSRFDGKRFDWKEDVKAVQYLDSLKNVDFYDLLPIFGNEGDIDLMNLSKSHWHPYARRIEQLFLQKLAPWHEEEEWRIVRVSFQDEVPEHRLSRFDHKALTGIFFGANTSQTTRNRVQSIFESSGTKPVFYECNVDGTRGVVPKKLDD